MSIKTENSEKIFREWKRDLLQRAHDWGEKHPEKPVSPPVITINPVINPKNPGNRAFVMPNTIIRVLESTLGNGKWNVWKDNTLVESFTGPLAQLQATRFASQLLDGDSTLMPAVSNSTMCIFCGGRFSHRTDCPDLKKDGPQME